MVTEKKENQQEKKKDEGFKDPAGLVFAGKIKIFDPETGEVLAEQRSE